MAVTVHGGMGAEGYGSLVGLAAQEYAHFATIPPMASTTAFPVQYHAKPVKPILNHRGEPILRGWSYEAHGPVVHEADSLDPATADIGHLVRKDGELHQITAISGNEVRTLAMKYDAKGRRQEGRHIVGQPDSRMDLRAVHKDQPLGKKLAARMEREARITVLEKEVLG